MFLRKSRDKRLALRLGSPAQQRRTTNRRRPAISQVCPKSSQRHVFAGLTSPTKGPSVSGQSWLSVLLELIFRLQLLQQLQDENADIHPTRVLSPRPLPVLNDCRESLHVGLHQESRTLLQRLCCGLRHSREASPVQLAPLAPLALSLSPLALPLSFSLFLCAWTFFSSSSTSSPRCAA